MSGCALLPVGPGTYVSSSSYDDTAQRTQEDAQRMSDWITQEQNQATMDQANQMAVQASIDTANAAAASAAAAAASVPPVNP